MEEKQEPIKDNCDIDQDDKKSITEEDIEEQEKSAAAEEEKKPVTKEDGGADTVESNDVIMTMYTQPTPLPCTSK